MDPIRRNMLATGAAATVMAAAPQVFAQQAGPGGAATSFYEKGDVRIRYEEVGSGFPLLVTPGGGLNSRDQQLADRGVQRDGGVQERLPLHHDGPAQRQRRRIHRPDPGRRPVGRLRRRPARADGPPRHPRVLLHGLLHRRLVRPQADGAGPASASSPACSASRSGTGRRTRTSCTIPAGMSGPPSSAPDGPTCRWRPSRSTCTTFTACGPTSCTACRATSRAPARRRCWSCRTTRRRTPYQTSIDIASLAPNAEVTVYPWKEPPELKARTINRVRNFLKAHQPVTAAR